MAKIKVLFVCLGNICRSPLAAAVFANRVKNVGLDDLIDTDSCGTGGYHVGELPDPRSIAVARDHNIPMDHHARQLIREDLSNFDYVIGMDDQNMSDIQAITDKPRAEIVKMRTFDSKEQGNDVPDPYYGGDDGFEKVYQMLDRSSEGLLDYICQQHEIDRS